LRVHCAALGHAIVGDPAYGIYGEASPNGGFSDSVMDQIAPHRASIALQKQLNNIVRINKTSTPMCLHAKRLSLHHPITGEKMTWEAPTPF
jgi:23S rRNA-/tRNA-specific pseudouridylate synthase